MYLYYINVYIKNIFYSVYEDDSIRVIGFWLVDEGVNEK